jgi:energy-coupling factor transporter ATP-binding protein EcfA2
MKKILALTGPKGSGKSTIALALRENNPAFHEAEILSFAQPLKTMVQTLLPPEAFLPENKEDPTYGLCGKSPRYILQTLGTEWGRALIGENIWVEQIRKKIKSLPGPILIDDLRFENEAEMIKNFDNSLIVRVERAGHHTLDSHASERGLPNHMIDAIITNKTIPELQKKAHIWNPWEETHTH